MGMAQYIIQILKTNLMVVFSWGFHHPVAIHNGLRFSVNGYLHKGQVEVIYDEGWDLFTVRAINTDGTIKEEQEGIYLDGLIATIDAMVEKCPGYDERVRRDYGLSNN